MTSPADHRKLSSGRIAAYGFGDFGFNLFYTGLNLYLLFYYTDVLKINPMTAGLIFMAPVIWDAVTDPVMGLLASRTRSRWGRYRPYVLFGAPFMALSFVAMFAAPLIFPGAVIAACLISHIVFRTAYTVVSIPYSALSAVMTSDGGERAKLAGARMVAAIGGGVLTAYSTLLLANRFGNGNLASGFVWVALLFAAIALLIMLVLFWTTSEEISDDATHERVISLKQSFAFLKNNSAFWIVFAGVFCSALGSSIGSKALVYYITYVVGEPDSVAIALSVSLLVTGLSVPLWAWGAQHLSKRDLWVGGAIGSALCQGMLLATAPATFAPLLAMVCLNAIFNGAFITMFWAMLPDTVEFGEWRTGIRDEGIVFGLNQFALKAASGFGVGALGIALGAIGYIADQPQDGAALSGLGWLSFGVPLLAAIVTALIIRKSPVTRRRHATIVRSLMKRKGR